MGKGNTAGNVAKVVIAGAFLFKIGSEIYSHFKQNETEESNGDSKPGLEEEKKEEEETNP